jgi:hypothetical protein
MLDKIELILLLTQSFYMFCLLDAVFKVNSSLKKKIREEKSVVGEILAAYMITILFFYVVIFSTYYLFFSLFNIYFSFCILAFDVGIRIFENTFSKEDEIS